MPTTKHPSLHANVVIVGGTPGGIMAGIAAARQGRSVMILERTGHVGGLPANGLGATDIGTRAATRGLFAEFVGRVRQHYVTTYGAESEQVKVCSDGYHFEPSVGEQMLLDMLAEYPQITVRLHQQFDAVPEHVAKVGRTVTGLTICDRATESLWHITGDTFIDATYEGDLAAAAGTPFRTRREGSEEYGEKGAGVFYCGWRMPADDEHTILGGGDHRIQAYNYRLCLTNVASNRLMIAKPQGYDRNEFLSLAEDLIHERAAGRVGNEREWNGIGRIVNMVLTPNGKTDSNNQHMSFISTDLPEENQPWPTASWAWRDVFAKRLRDYTLGLIYFIQNDATVPESFRVNASQWGLAKDEYVDNENFPRQVYVREGRRIEGDYLFTANDALPVAEGARPPVHGNSITASHYSIDSHACRKRELGKPHLDGFLNFITKPYTVPYGVIVARDCENVWIPVPVSATHLGFGTLRMEPCWMALGEAAGTAAAIAIDLGINARQVPIDRLQHELIRGGAQLVHIPDLDPKDAAWSAAQLVVLRGGLVDWNAETTKPVTSDDASRWARLLNVDPAVVAGATNRGEAFTKLGAALGLVSARGAKAKG